MFPRPKPCVLGALGKLAVFIIFRVDQRYITVVGFGFLVNDVENAFRTGKRRQNVVELLGKVGQRLGKRAGILQKRKHRAHGKRVADDEHAARRRDCRVNDMGEVAHNRHQGAGVSVGAGRRVLQFVVEGGKRLNRFLLVVKDLDDLLPFNRFFNKAVCRAEGFLLCAEIARAFAAHFFNDDQHHRNGDKHQNG